MEKQAKLKLGWVRQLGDALLKPSVIAVVLVALIGPPTVEQVNQQIENARIEAERVINQRELQTKILTQLLDYANAAGTDAQAMQKISLLTSFVKDNEQAFGLVFPSVPDLIAQGQRFERNKIGMEVTSLNATLAMQQTDMQKLEDDIALLQATLPQQKPESEQLAQQQLRLQELQERMSQERQMREAIQLSLRDRQAQIAAMDQYVVQETAAGQESLRKLLSQLKGQSMDQRQLSQLTEQLVNQLQNQLARTRMLGEEAFTALE